jgi:hypothetical protein
MNGCQFPSENLIGESFKISLDVDQCEVESHTFCEIPVSGPGLANTLVIITGIAVPAADTDIGTGNIEVDTTCRGDIYVKTDYIVNPPDPWLNIVDGNQTLLHATYVTLASIVNESEGKFLFAVDEVFTQRNTDGRIQVIMRTAIRGDATLARIAYQASILIRKAT